MAKHSKLKQKLVPVEVDFGDGDIVKMTIRPFGQGWKEAKEWQRKLKESEDEETISLLRNRFVETVTEWDLEGEGDQVIPLTVEGLEQSDMHPLLMADFLVKAYEGISEKKTKSGRA